MTGKTEGGEMPDTSKMYDIEHEYYDILFSDLDHDFQFYLDMAKESGTPILECMCGTGRILLHLAKNGFEVDGFDLNEKMLSRAEEKIAAEPEHIRNKITIWKDDLRTFKSNKKYSLIIIPFSSFLHLLNDEDRLKALAAVKQHLVEGGRFVVEFFNPDLTRPENVLRFESSRTRELPGGEKLVRFYSQKFNRKEKTMQVHYFYDVIQPDGTVKRKINVMDIAYMFHDDMKELLDKSGFSVVEVYGDHDKTAFSESSPNIIWVLGTEKEEKEKV